jgi:small-conductance mechanosensitive channel
MSNTTEKLPPIRAEDVHREARTLIESSWDWIHSNWLQVLIALGIATAIVLALTAARGLGTRLAARSRSGKGWAAIFGRAIEKTNQFFIVMLAAQLVTGYAEAPAAVSQTVKFLFTIATVFQAAVWARELILGAIEHRTRSETYNGEALMSAMGLIRLLVSFAVFAIALVVVLDNLGVNVTGLVAGLGVGGIAIGLAAQGIFADLFAALAIIFDRPFRRGENILFDSSGGTIEAIGLKSTRIRSFSGELRIISNRNLLDKEIQNISDRTKIRIKYMIGVAYETPPETLERLPDMLIEMVEAEGAEASRSGFESFGASSLDYALWVDTQGGDWSVAHGTRNRLLIRIMKRFAEEGIVIAYPTQTTFTAAPDGTLVMPWAEPKEDVQKAPMNTSTT